MNYVITCQEKIKYKKTKKTSKRLEIFWLDLIRQLPSKLRKEAKEKRFRLSLHPLNKDLSPTFAHNLMFAVPKASKALKEAIRKLHNIIICMEEPI